MHKLCSWLGVLVSSLSVGSACWAQTPQLVRSPGMDVGNYLLLLESCELLSPGFKTATDSVHEQWRRENATDIAAVEASAEFKANLAATPQRVRALSPKDLGELKDMCAQMASLPDATLRQMGNDFAKFAITDSFRQGGKYQEGFAVRHDGQGYLVYFEEYNGEWLISQM